MAQNSRKETPLKIQFYYQDSTQHRQSSCAVYRTAALPVLAGLADVEIVTTHSTTARILPCAADGRRCGVW